MDLDIDEEKLNRNSYSGSPARRRNQQGNRSAPAESPLNRETGSPVLRRQEVKEAFGDDLQALNEAVFRQAEEKPIEPTELNPDVELLIDTLSNRLTEDSSRARLREFADLARDPLREGADQSEN